MELQTPLTKEKIESLKSGDYVYITGTIYTARDAAHKRMSEALANGEELPIDVKDQIIYHMGPTPAKEGQVMDQLDQLLLVEWISMRQSY